MNDMTDDKTVELDVHVTFKNELAEAIITEAERRNMSAVELLADIVEAVVNDNLFTAVLDTDGQPDRNGV